MALAPAAANNGARGGLPVQVGRAHVHGPVSVPVRGAVPPCTCSCSCHVPVRCNVVSDISSYDSFDIEGATVRYRFSWEQHSCVYKLQVLGDEALAAPDPALA